MSNNIIGRDETMGRLQVMIIKHIVQQLSSHRDQIRIGEPKNESRFLFQNKRSGVGNQRNGET